MSNVTVVTTAIETRMFDMLPNHLDSVAKQTVRPHGHIISVDYDRIGAGANANRAVQSVDTEFFFMIADDDIMYPNCLERLLANAEGADFVYPWCKVTGRGSWNPNSPFDGARLRKTPYIPGNVLHRTETFREIGGYTEGIIMEDYDYQRATIDQDIMEKRPCRSTALTFALIVNEL